MLERKEIEAYVEHNKNKTPSNTDVKKLITEHFKIDQDMVVVKHIYSKFGEASSKVFAYIYENKDVFNSVEVIKKSKRKKGKKTEAKAEEAK